MNIFAERKLYIAIAGLKNTLAIFKEEPDASIWCLVEESRTG
jgi:hypothetical protein